MISISNQRIEGLIKYPPFFVGSSRLLHKICVEKFHIKLGFHYHYINFIIFVVVVLFRVDQKINFYKIILLRCRLWSYHTLPTAILQISYEFLIFFKPISRTFKREQTRLFYLELLVPCIGAISHSFFWNNWSICYFIFTTKIYYFVSSCKQHKEVLKLSFLHGPVHCSFL